MRHKTDLGKEERKALHGEAYVERFERAQAINRITRLVPLMAMDGTEKIVDIGCGNALSLTALNGRFSSYAGIDFSAPFIKAARLRARSLGIENAEFFCGSAEAFAEENATKFDVALALDISEHVYDTEWLIMLRAVYKMLKAGGRLFVHTPNSTFFVEIMKEKNIILTQFPEHIAVRTMDENIQLLQEAGYGIRAAHTLPHYNFLSVLHPLSKVPHIGRHFVARLFIEAEKPGQPRAA